MVVHVLHNPSTSRSAQTSTRSIIAALRADGERVIDISGATASESSLNLASAMGAGEVERLFIAGGDGLVHLAIQHLALTNVAVTIAPIGSGNDFAQAVIERTEATGSAGISSDLMRIATPDAMTTWAASVAIAGFPARINARANTMGRSWGSNVYALATIRELPTFARSSFDVSIDGIPLTTDSAMLAIGNTKYFGGGMLPCPDARPDDGMLHLTSIEGVNRLRLMPHLIGRAGGTAGRKEVVRGVGTLIEIETRGQAFWADGEEVGLSPLSFEIVPGALRIERITQEAL